ncbi:MAG TPA: hypothetical protein VFV87_20525 [Pirellulaceae bacterium]|nr:hypothetical protein [Pirellulaceae bacterium]
MTIGDWLGLVCLAGLVGFFAGGFFVWNLFYKVPQPDDGSDDGPEDDGPEDDEDESHKEDLAASESHQEPEI